MKLSTFMKWMFGCSSLLTACLLPVVSVYLFNVGPEWLHVESNNKNGFSSGGFAFAVSTGGLMCCLIIAGIALFCSALDDSDKGCKT